MRILELQNIATEDGYIYYRKNYTATALIEIPGSKLESPVKFCIETSPFGTKSIEIEISSALNYPVLPVKKALKEFILSEDSQGRLP